MSSDLTFTGERFLPSCCGEIAYEHWHRYAFARRFVEGKPVLDAACGEGYGTAYLAEAAAAVVGIDLDLATIAHAGVRYAFCERARFVQGSCSALPFANGSFDVVVSFETVEHLDAAEQVQMLAEFARVLAPTGLLVISSPNKRLYSEVRGYVNEFHRHELYREDFTALLAREFPVQQWYHQRLACWSGIWSEGEATGIDAWLGDGERVAPYAHPEGMYFIVVATRPPGAIEPPVRVSLFTDAADSELKRSEANAAEVLRLDRLLGEHVSVLDRQTMHIRHLETLLAEHDRELAAVNAALVGSSAALAARAGAIAERDARLVDHEHTIDILQTRVRALEDEFRELSETLGARERVIAYRGSWRWWIKLPLVRIKRWIDAW